MDKKSEIFGVYAVALEATRSIEIMVYLFWVAQVASL